MRYAKPAIKLLLMLIAVAVLASCGYRVHKPTVSAVVVGPFKNLTYEPGLEDLLSESLKRELAKNGIRVLTSGGSSVKGTFKEFELKIISEVKELTRRYSVEIRDEFFIVDPDGAKQELPGGGKYIIVFSAEGEMEEVIAGKELATRRAMDDLAEELAAAVLFD